MRMVGRQSERCARARSSKRFARWRTSTRVGMALPVAAAASASTVVPLSSASRGTAVPSRARNSSGRSDRGRPSRPAGGGHDRAIRRAPSKRRPGGWTFDLSTRPTAATSSTTPGATRPFPSGSTAEQLGRRHRGIGGSAADRRRARRRRSPGGDRGAASRERLGLPFHSAGRGSRRAQQVLMARERLRAAGLPTPWLSSVDARVDPRTIADVAFPCVVKPRRAVRQPRCHPSRRPGRFGGCARAVDRGSARCASQCPSDAADELLIEEFIPGREFAVEGVMTRGRLQRPGDLRQARPARRPVLRGDHLRDAAGVVMQSSRAP